jgi:hypothetical protein
MQFSTQYSDRRFNLFLCSVSINANSSHRLSYLLRAPIEPLTCTPRIRLVDVDITRCRLWPRCTPTEPLTGTSRISLGRARISRCRLRPRWGLRRLWLCLFLCRLLFGIVPWCEPSERRRPGTLRRRGRRRCVKLILGDHVGTSGAWSNMRVLVLG